jgi:hypothetical protein
MLSTIMSLLVSQGAGMQSPRPGNMGGRLVLVVPSVPYDERAISSSMPPVGQLSKG